MTSDDLTFFTNDGNVTLLDRFKSTLKYVQFFDVLVGYFRTSGFYLLEDAFASIEKIRILVGMNVDAKTYEIVETYRGQGEFNFDSHRQAQEAYAANLTLEMEHSEDRPEVEHGIRRFLEYLQCGKLEIRAHPSQNIHAKVYISRFNPDNSPDFGRVITGSSNFSQSGFQDQYEFNVELKNKSDVKFALEHFENLWAESVELNETYIQTVTHSTWLNDQITPYELYLKLLYEYFKEDINLDQDYDVYLPEGFMELDYQKQAVIAAKKILETYNGVFLSDVVGLGKTYIAALLAQQLPGKKLIICPPVLVEYWKETFFQFGIAGFQVESLGRLDHILESGPDKYQYVFVDEAHRFRNEITQGYEKLHQICWGKKVILVSATPLNNTINDIYSQLKLFQRPRQSTIPGVPNLEKFFTERNNLLKRLDKGTPEYVAAVKAISKEIRERILKYIMVRRTRSEIMRFFARDIKSQGLTFPAIDEPHRIVYQFSPRVNAIFNQTIEELQGFTYSRYTPLLYSIRPVSEFDAQSQRNVGGFMKGVLVKRLESSFYAFKSTLARFIKSYERFIEMYHSGTIYISNKVNIYDLLDADNEEELLRLVEQDKVQKYASTDFTPKFIDDLNADLDLLKRVQKLWADVRDDPKLAQFVRELNRNPLLAGKQAILFTESAETGEYLYSELEKEFPGRIMFYCSGGGTYRNISLSKTESRNLIKRNFDPSNHEPVGGDVVKLLITTDVLAEGINLHRANIVINYDLPWNPTKVLQRVGRVNRVGSQHPMIHIFNFFPTDQSDIHLGLEDNIKAKLYAFQNLLGEDAKYLTNEEEVGSFELFGDYLYKKLNTKATYEGEEEQERSELEYLQIIRDVRDQQPELFSQLKRLPKKARSCRHVPEGEQSHSLLTFFRRGRLKKFFLAARDPAAHDSSQELTFLEAADLLRCGPEELRRPIPAGYYDLLQCNKERFELQLSPVETENSRGGGGRTNEQYVMRRLKAREIRTYRGYTDEDEDFIRQVIKALEDGVVPRNTSKKIKQKLERMTDPLKILKLLRQELSETLLQSYMQQQVGTVERREVILSEYLIAEE
ncbi:MAG: NgoFVII family restriction endonuclease [Chloroflexi bacterium]|nr:NgoFVII family restriction endonuclease [Chloroflexota bacterium]